MSYILDALKKSEQERQQQQGPTLQSVHRSRGHRYPGGTPWRGLTVAMLLVVALAGGGWWLQRPDVSDSEAEATPAPAPAPLAATPATPLQEDTRATSVPDEPIEAQPAQPPAPRQQPQATGPVVAFDQLPDPVRRAVPPMTFSMHVFSENPERRTIIINKRRMKEGDSLSEDLTLLEINRQGVVMAWQAHRFYINVVEQW